MLTADFEIDDLLDALDAVDDELGRVLPQALQQAGDRAAAYAKTTHDYVDRSSELTNSIAADHVIGSWAADTLAIEVAAGAPHAAAIEFGAKAHFIRAKHRKALRIPVEGGFRFAKVVSHPGNKPFRYLSNALEATMPDTEEEMAAAVDLAFLRAGLG